ncbi:nickel-responsive transcriptional regulator NikR [Methylobacterium sp. BTF04]|uniref:nickel-responsive transcriptional regulator NikR n=1 Tax=Methylobacterium sp. BTF04 TaxID=2708300 RepID=UPI0013D280A4|nr:nickel-responsive transcriptional regulator NikR [Methylobacterium sp. BTF04]NEU14844.1 nickel-responsive transcriptional regulator NikR [Methylobacterium sp. BTF04]
MQRITVTIDDDLLAAVDKLCERRGYGSRSEAVRDIVAPSQAALAGDTPFYGALSYVYSHGTRDLARRLTDEGHHHGVSVASVHVDLTRDDCLEVAVLRGSVAAMQSFADSVTTQRGVRHGHLHLIPEGGVESDDHAHAHGETGGD